MPGASGTAPAVAIIAAMRRILILLLALLLPLQLAWAGAAAYCGHEKGAASSRHFGHHSHAHQERTAAGHADGEGAKLPDLDCAMCHFAGSHGLVPATDWSAAPGVATLQYHPLATTWRSALARAPDRPQWSRPA